MKMKTLLFFDDWFLQNARGIKRSFKKAKLLNKDNEWCEPLAEHSSGTQVIYDEKRNIYRFWGCNLIDVSKGDEGVAMFYYECNDGLNFKPVKQFPPVDSRATEGLEHMVYSGKNSCHGAPFYDELDTDPNRRYKIAYSDLSPDPKAPNTTLIAVSPDGIHWSIDEGVTWNNQHTDTIQSILYNQYTKKYQFTSRPILGDRRVALYQTTDFKTFEKHVIIHPDTMDKPMMEFYGMPHFHYEDYFIGFLWKMHGGFNDHFGSTRMLGTVDSELVYSVNGLSWNRTNRDEFYETYDCYDPPYLRSYYPVAFIPEDHEGNMRIYINVSIGEHGDPKDPTENKKSGYLSVYSMRKDGFVSLESESDNATLMLRAMVSKGGDILVNARTSAQGYIKAQLRGVYTGKIIEGYEFINSIPFTKNGLETPLVWKDRKNLDSIKDTPFRLELEMFQAELYAVRLDCDYLFGFIPERDLNGNFIEGICI